VFGVFHSEFANLLSVAFLSLRKHGAFLVWVLTNGAAQLGIPAAQVRYFFLSVTSKWDFNAVGVA
jgi:hypothetical protein